MEENMNNGVVPSGDNNLNENNTNVTQSPINSSESVNSNENISVNENVNSAQANNVPEEPQPINNNEDNSINVKRFDPKEMRRSIYNAAKAFKRKYPLTIAFRIRSHAKAAAKFISTGEEVEYVFLAQKNYSSHEFANTNIVVLTNKRILVLTKRIVFGYFYKSITIDMFNDLTIKEGIIWGKVIIDTVKELVILSNIDKRALNEIEQRVSEVLLEQKAAIFAESRIM